MLAHVNIHEPKTRVDEQTPFSYSMEGLNRNQPGELIPYVWQPGWNSNQAVFKYQEEVSGALTGGDPGVRLITGRDANADEQSPFAPSQALPGGEAGDGFRVLPLWHIFGSDELSMRSPPIVERAADPYVVLNPADANNLGVAAGGGVRCDEFDVALEVRIDAAMAPGNAAMTLGFPGVAASSAGQRLTLAVDPAFVRKRNVSQLIAKG
jgi:NADH-quinone oxidoreductase subunit G